MIGFIGSGNMARAIVAGLVTSGVPSHSIVVTSRGGASAAALAERHDLSLATSNQELVEKVAGGDIVLAVKPHQIPAVAADLDVPEGTTIISVAAGTTIETLTGLFPGARVIRVMPNVNAAIGQSMTALAGGPGVTDEDLDRARGVFDSVGNTTVIDESLFGPFSALAGCSPAFTFEFIEALARGGVKNGLRVEEAIRYAAQAVAGSAALVLASLPESSPANLRDTVTSPGGTTIAGIVAMDGAGFTPAVTAGVQAAIDRDREMTNS